MNYVISVGLQLVVSYGWPARAYQDADKCTLTHDRPLPVRGNEIRTVDIDDGSDAFYGLGIEHPLVFNCSEAADHTVERFQIQNATITPWKD